LPNGAKNINICQKTTKCNKDLIGGQ